MKKFFSEFKEFAMRGNVIDLAVGVIIGAAFKAIVDSLVGDIISPLLGIFLKEDFSSLCITLGGVDLAYGKFIMAVLNFLIMAFVLFSIVRTFNRLAGLRKKDEPEAEPTTKKCPFCKSEIDIAALKCPHCTADIPESAE